MQALLDAVVDLVALVSPAKVRTVASALRGITKPDAAPAANTLADTPAARAAVARVVAAWAQVQARGDEVAGMLLGASEARLRVELVWTGLTTRFVPTRRTEQVLLDLAGASVFLTSGEVEFARRHKSQMVLYVLHSIQLSEGDGAPQGGVHTVFWPWDVEGRALAPIKYVYGLP
ncbi:MAG TPA: hypothetical protein VFZ09_32745 [Archangium sp.]|uniref:hypothetical protein n=1 Tax=Archangium sp. TaxID=1872627 RepID=UPI002E375E2D|nr:hypothetical protein [Archangium sp.]HEX5751041.1 hypothetical protein [Archangium sp.]